MNNLATISLAQFIRQGMPDALNYDDKLVISQTFPNTGLFSHPCRLDATAIFLCLGGEIRGNINLQPYQVESSSIIVKTSSDVLQIHESRDVECYMILMSDDFLDELQIDFHRRSSFIISMRKNALAHIPFDEIQRLRHYYNLLAHEVHCRHEESRHVIDGLVHAFCYTIIGLIQRHQQREDERLSANPGLMRREHIFNQFMTLLSQHYTTQRSVQFYARSLCLSPNYFSGAIKRVSGRNALEWINDQVVLEAKILLRSTDLSIQEIAFRLNFPTQSAFGKYFKQQVGVGPKAYRNAAVSSVNFAEKMSGCQAEEA